MLRILAIVLLLGNALLLAAQFGVLDPLVGSSLQVPQREPGRLQRQVNPDLVRILSPQAASAALAAAAASTAQTAARAAAAASSANALVCLEAGPFDPAGTDAAERSLHDAGLAPGSWQSLSTETRGAYLVYMGRFADREALQRKRAELEGLKLQAEELRGAPELQPGLTLGRFDDRGAADAALAALAPRGVRSARVVTLRPAQKLTVLRLPAASAAMRARVAALAMPSGPGFVACAGSEAAVAASAEPAASATGAAGAAAAAANRPDGTASAAAGGRR